jgi:cellulose synthase/poly-beta-1,6-N-acetylglucosamine synthase-like glycosyltransferase
VRGGEREAGGCRHGCRCAAVDGGASPGRALISPFPPPPCATPPSKHTQAGWFPEWTLTEDFALGIELKKLQWQCRYVSEYLVIGEAPEEVRNCFQQRSRWSKGHFQVGGCGADGWELGRWGCWGCWGCQQAGRAGKVPHICTCTCLPSRPQVFFSAHNPIFARGLSPLMRWMYGSVILSYFSAFLSTPLLMLIPMITVGG